MGYWDKMTPVEAEAEAVDLEQLEAEGLEAAGEIEQAFRDRMKQEKERYRDVCDSEYWFAVCFTSRAQRNEFLKKIGIDPELKYIDGHEMAKAYRKAIKTPDLEFAQTRPFDKEYLKRVRE